MNPEQLPDLLDAANYSSKFLPHWYNLLLYSPNFSLLKLANFLEVSYPFVNVFGFKKFRKIKPVFLNRVHMLL